MKRYLVLEKSILLCVGMLLGSCSTNSVMSSGGDPISGGQIVEMRGVYSVRAPSGNGWTMRTDKSKGFMGFNRGIPDEKTAEMGGKFTAIGVFPGYLFPGKENQSEETIADMIFTDLERIETQGGVAGEYSLRDVSKDVVTIGNKKLYVMTYTVSEHSPVAREIKAAKFLYLPPEIKYTRDFCVFQIGDVVSSKETVYETDLNIIHEVIESFRYRDRPYR
jgi:hypothetical protein